MPTGKWLLRATGPRRSSAEPPAPEAAVSGAAGKGPRAAAFGTWED